VNWTNLGLITAAIAALAGAAVAIYRSRPQRDLDTNTARKIELEIKRESAAYDRRRTIRLLRLEKYVDQDIVYHREDRTYHLQLRELLEIAKKEGFLPRDTVIPEPPVPPELPRVDDDDDD
jgi:hypothetical protein